MSSLLEHLKFLPLLKCMLVKPNQPASGAFDKPSSFIREKSTRVEPVTVLLDEIGRCSVR